MGHDPSTHQVWVRIIGLPLQAWTATEINEILQRFGHPLDVLPFGQEAGHYKHITALIATKSPSQIPLAYVYREGDYSTQIEIHILSWRPWENSYFPPPDTPPSQGDSQTQRQQGNTPTAPGRRSSSSSASETLSEPTIDLSSWSPRTSRPISTYTSKWVPKPQKSLNPPQQREYGSTSLTQAPATEVVYFGHNQSSFQIDMHGCDHNTATKKQTSNCVTQRKYSLFRLSLLFIPRPIAINPFPSLHTLSAHGSTLTKFQDKTDTAAPRLTYTLALMLSKEKVQALNEIVSARAAMMQFKCQRQMLQVSSQKGFSQSPRQPNISKESREVSVKRAYTNAAFS